MNPNKPVIHYGNEITPVDINWLWKPFIPFGKVTLITGDGGDGKTTMILTIAAMLSQGKLPPTLENGRLLPSSACEPALTFYLSNEDEVSDSIIKRFTRAGGNAARFAFSGELEHHMVLAEHELLAAIEETRCRLFIVDPIQAFLPDGVSMTSAARMRPVYTMLSNVAKKTGVAIVLIGHLNKNSSGKDIHRVMGSADNVAAVRSVLMVEKSCDDRNLRWVRAIKCNFDECDYTPVQLILDEKKRLSFGELPPDVPDPKPKSESKIARAQGILRELIKDDAMAVSEIHEAMAREGIGQKTAQRAKTEIGAKQYYEDGKPVWGFQTDRWTGGQVDSHRAPNQVASA